MPTTQRPSAQHAQARKVGLGRVGRRGFLGGALGIFAASAGGSAWALDRFVLDDVAVTDVAAYEAEQGVTPATQAADATWTAASYTSDTATITITEKTSSDGGLTYFVADVKVTDVSAIRAGLANNEFGQNIIENPSTIAANLGAVLAINGDYYGFRETGIVIRNGVAYRDRGARTGLALDGDGALRLYDETETSADALVKDGIWQTWSFGPGLVDNGSVIEGIDEVEVDTNFGNHSVQGSQPRTGVGMIAPLHYVWVVADGRSDHSRGVTMSEFAEIFVDLGATVAYNLDGGGSSTMVFRNPDAQEELVNNPLGRGEERGTSDIIYVAG